MMRIWSALMRGWTSAFGTRWNCASALFRHGVDAHLVGIDALYCLCHQVRTSRLGLHLLKMGGLAPESRFWNLSGPGALNPSLPSAFPLGITPSNSFLRLLDCLKKITQQWWTLLSIWELSTEFSDAQHKNAEHLRIECQFSSVQQVKKFTLATGAASVAQAYLRVL